VPTLAVYRQGCAAPMKARTSSSSGGFSSAVIPISVARANMAGDSESVISRIRMPDPSASSFSASCKPGHIGHVVVQDQASQIVTFRR
jgi:hypothetical protein